MDRNTLRVVEKCSIEQQSAAARNLTLRFLVYEDEDGNLITVRADPPPPAPRLGLEPRAA